MTPAQTDPKAAAAALEELRNAYPGAYWGDGQWDGVLTRYTPALTQYPPNVIKAAFESVTDAHRDKFPTLPQLQAKLLEQYRRWQDAMWERNKSRALPPAPKSRQDAIDTFQAQVRRALDAGLGDRITEDNRHVLEGCVAVLGPVYGFTASSMQDDGGFDWCRGYASVWRRHGFSPTQVLRALQQAPDAFSKFPTSGMLTELIQTGRARDWPQLNTAATEPHQE